MKNLALWQQAVVIVIAIASLGFVVFHTARLQGRTSEGTATARKGTAAESGLYGAEAQAGAEVFDGFSYRVGARFAGRARVVVDGDSVAFCGPRGPRGLYWFWIWAIGIASALIAPALAWGIVAFDWRGFAWAAAFTAISVAVMAVGAGVWPGLGEVPGLEDGHYPALEHRIADARDVTFGPGWANGGLNWILLPYTNGIDKLAEGHAVSWFGPDETGREVRYALHVYDEAQAVRLYGLMSGSDRP